MTTAEFLTHLRKLDIKVWVEGDRLKFNAPTEAVTDDLKNELAARKEDLLQFLKKQDLRVSVPVKEVQRVSRDKNLPASFGQRPLWFLEQLEPANVSNYIPCGLHLKGTVDREVLEKCINEIIRRHEVLRTNFILSDDQPVQVINLHHEFRIEWEDLQYSSVSDQAGMLQRLATEEIRRPFDLSEGSLLRVKLYGLAPDEYLLLLTVHHLVFDGASFGVFFEELSVLYQAYIAGGDSPLADLPYQYVDYSVCQDESMQDGAMAQQLSYWSKQLGGRLPVLELPTDHPRPSIQTYNGARQVLRIGSDAHQRLKSLAQQESCTLFMALVSVLQTLLHRYTGQDEIILGSPISNRTLPDSERLIGMFLNMLVLRTSMDGDPSFRALLKRVRDVTLDAYSNQDVPFDRIVRSLQVDRDPSRNPVFQVLLQLSPAEGYVLDIPGIAASAIEVDSEAAQFDLVLHLFEEENGISGHFEYNTDLFSSETMTRTANHFQVLLESALTDPDAAISTLSILDDEEVRQLARWNDTAADIPEVAGLYQLFEEQAAKTPDALAVTFVTEHLTYRELNERANQLAYHLRTQGVAPDQLVGLFVERSLDMLVGVLGIMKSGAAYVPLDPSYPQDRLAFMLADSGADLLVTESALLERRPIVDITTICLDTDWAHIGALPSDNLLSLSGPDNLAYAIYTSGSTGLPKGVLIPHRCAVNFLWSMSKNPGLCADDTLLSVTTLSFDIAVLELYLPLCVGAHCHIVPLETAMDAVQLMRALTESGATAIQATPITYRMLLEADWMGHGQLKILCGGEAIDADLAGKLLPRCAELWNMYGPTETTVWSIIHQIHHEDASILVGHPIANTQVHILDDHLQPVPVGVTGELYIGGEGLARGYHNRPELTAERFVPDPFDGHEEGRLYRTGDLARRRSDGTVECLGRVDFQVKVRGYRIELGEIESAMTGFEGLKQAVVVAWDGLSGDRRLVGYYTTEADQEVSHDLVRSELRGKLPEYMVPAVFMKLDAFPVTPNGKIDRSALPEPNRIELESKRTVMKARDALESQLTEIWEQVLEINPISIKDNFFDIGGYSLLAVRVFNAIREATGKSLPLATLFQASTIEELAAVMRKGEERKDSSVLVSIQPKGTRTPFFCVHGQYGNVLLFADLARHLGEDQPFYAFQSMGLKEGETPLKRVEIMAATYIEEMRSVQPSGPYLLGGLCFGGLIALEMARQLRIDGEEVGLVALLDMLPRVIPGLLPSSVIDSYNRYVNKDRIDSHSAQLDGRSVSGKVAYLVSGLADKVKETVQNAAAIASESISGRLGLELPEAFQKVDLANTLAFRAYKPQPCQGDVDVFLSKDISDGYSQNPKQDWSGVALGAVEVHLLKDEGISGHRAGAGMFVEPHVQELARQLNGCIEERQGSETSH